MLCKQSSPAFKNQNGIGLILAVGLAGILMVSMVLMASFYFEKLLAATTRTRNRIIALQLAQDFAVLAQKANDSWVEYGTCAAPNPFNNQWPAGKRFCWGNGATVNCVRSQADASFVSGVPSQICFDFATAATGVIRLTQNSSAREQQRNWFERRLDVYASVFRERKLIAAEVKKYFIYNVAGWFSSEAVAEATYRPALAAAPTNRVAQIACAVAADAAANPGCKVCRGIAGSTTECLTIQVCSRLDGNCGPITSLMWIQQTIAIIPRT